MFVWLGWFEWLSILLAGFSFFSLVQKLFGFGVASIFKDLVSFYRAVFYPIADVIMGGLHWLFALVSIELPHIPQDIVVTYTLIGSALCKYSVSDFRKAARHWEKGEVDSRGGTTRATEKPSKLTNVIKVGLYSLIWPVALFLGLKQDRVICAFEIELEWKSGKINRITNRPPTSIVVELKFRDWAWEITKVAIAFIVLFIANAYFTYEQSETKSANATQTIETSK